jgi:hypothetical protein
MARAYIPCVSLTGEEPCYFPNGQAITMTSTGIDHSTQHVPKGSDSEKVISSRQKSKDDKQTNTLPTGILILATSNDSGN